MIKHYILSIDPKSEFSWEKSVLREPLTGARADLMESIAQQVDNQPGSYLVALNVEVEILEASSTPQNQLTTDQLTWMSQGG